MPFARPANEKMPCAAKLGLRRRPICARRPPSALFARAAPAPILITQMEHRTVRMVNRDVAPFFGPGSCPARVRATVRARHAPAATRKMLWTPARANCFASAGTQRISEVLRPAATWLRQSRSRATPRSEVTFLKARPRLATLPQHAKNTLDGRPRR